MLHCTYAVLDSLAIQADELILNSTNHIELEEFIQLYSNENTTFENDFCKGYFYYILANCNSYVFQYRNENWYSQELINTVNLYKQAIYFLKINNQNSQLLSFALTNLGNYLSSQGRVLCAIQHWQQAIAIDKNPVALVALASNQLFIANHLSDSSHACIQYFFVNEILSKNKQEFERLEEEQQTPLQYNGRLSSFKQWFNSNFKLNDFAYVSQYQHEFNSKSEQNYLTWVAKNKLFINDLNDVYDYQIVYQDIIGLPSMSYTVNDMLNLREELVFHSIFDELRNDFCYARYLIFLASEIKSDSSHFYNLSYPHTNEGLNSIDNLKTSHLKSAFRILYSIFDKISYFLAKYLNLSYKQDSSISFNSMFGAKKNAQFQPRDELKNSKNCFIHALFYILKEIEKDNEDFSNNGNTQTKLAFLRNHIEHRSFRIVTHVEEQLEQQLYDKFLFEQDEKSIQLSDFKRTLEDKSLAKENRTAIDNQILELEKEIEHLKFLLSDKDKRSKIIFTCSLNTFEEHTQTLAKLVRNSLIYLSLAINYEEIEHHQINTPIFTREVPLK